ncbi:unnamed protein product, partial [Durusdinium trenchii]
AMRDCPWPLLDAFACNNCVAPPVGFRPAALLQKTRAAHAAFARGQTLFKDPLRWTSGELSCKPAATDALYEARAIGQLKNPMAAKSVACLYLAALPNDYPTLRRVADTFAYHCDWAKFFAAPSRTKEPRRSWHITARHQVFEIVNLASFFPDAQTDESWMQTQWEGDTVKDVFRTRLYSGNTIQKSLLMAVHVGRHHLDQAELFCWLELDSAFIADNLRAFARVQGLHAKEPHFVAALHLGMKLQVGIFPHTAGGVCLTQEALRRLSQHLELQKMDAVRYEHPKRVMFWAPQVVSASRETAARVHGCGFVAGHWWDIMLGRCMVASNVTAHPAVEDELGRYYFATEPLPCQEHLNSRQLPQLRSPHMEGSRLPRVANALCDIYGFMPEYSMGRPVVIGCSHSGQRWRVPQRDCG